MDAILKFEGSTNKQRISSDYEENFDNPGVWWSCSASAQTLNWWPKIIRARPSPSPN
jgi:hypothetical protein